jgi:SAM-dependent methyltransferase
MLEESRSRIVNLLSPSDVVLDVGGWAKPFSRADWVLDLQPFETRGLYGYDEGERGTERFTEETWVIRDICSHEAWPFQDDQFDFVICSHTLEDVRDPIRVCEELQRVGKAGYIEVPSRLEEQTVGVNGEWPGWAHHRWLCDIDEHGIQFVHKSHALSAQPQFTVPMSYTDARPISERRSTLWWEGGFSCEERVIMSGPEMDEYLAEGVPPDAAARPRGGRFRQVRAAARWRAR